MKGKMPQGIFYALGNALREKRRVDSPFRIKKQLLWWAYITTCISKFPFASYMLLMPEFGTAPLSWQNDELCLGNCRMLGFSGFSNTEGLTAQCPGGPPLELGIYRVQFLKIRKISFFLLIGPPLGKTRSPAPVHCAFWLLVHHGVLL